MEITHFSEEDHEQIEKLIPDQVPKLRKILEEKHNLIVPAHCDELLARCIRMEHGNLENAIKLVKAYHTATGEFPSWDAEFKPSRDMHRFNERYLMVISQQNHEGRIVFIGRIGPLEPNEMGFDQAMAHIWMMLQYITAVSKDAQRNGIVTIWYFTGYSMKHFWMTKISKIPYLIKLIQSHTVGTINEFHAVNHPKIFRILFSSFIQPFLGDSLQKWIFFHDNVESLHSRFNKNGLPKFLGGNQEVEECMDLNIMKNYYGLDQYYSDMMNDRFPRY